jgi:hypothetical protein
MDLRFTDEVTGQYEVRMGGELKTQETGALLP